jgi:biofilm PGA synthesis N-glycosyltransferase PgaC
VAPSEAQMSTSPSQDRSSAEIRLSYAVVTAARDEAANLHRLGGCLASQTLIPKAWIVVENGSTDDTVTVACELAGRYPWLQAIHTPGNPVPTRGAPIVRALHAGFVALNALEPDVVAIVDADISMPPEHFERLVKRFAIEPALGIASGSRWEEVDGQWRQQFVTGTSVEASCRAYRWQCLQDVLPFEERMGWVGIAEVKAIVRGWTTRVLLNLPFRHHRDTGVRERTRAHGWFAEGNAGWYMGYRPYYLVLRSLHRARRDIHALAMIAGYTSAALRSEPRHHDAAVRSYIREKQSLLNLRRRIKEALGRHTPQRALPGSNLPR